MINDGSGQEVQFLAFKSAREGEPVQDWLNQIRAGGLDEHIVEIRDRIVQLEYTPASEWDEPFFDPLIGEEGISEIRVKEIRCLRGKFCYRMYGVFDGDIYILLHGTNKQRRNDRHGKAIAKRRLRELELHEAETHEINLD